MIGLFTLILFFIAFVYTSVVFGVDSRDGSTDPNRSAYPVGIR